MITNILLTFIFLILLYIGYMVTWMAGQREARFNKIDVNLAKIVNTIEEVDTSIRYIHNEIVNIKWKNNVEIIHNDEKN